MDCSDCTGACQPQDPQPIESWWYDQRMSILRRLARDLRDLEADLRDRPAVAARLHEVARLLESDEVQWVGTTEAKRLLGVDSENTVKAWARLGLLRSRTLPNGRLQVLLDDLLERKASNADLAGPFADDGLSPEELDALSGARPGTLPWQRHEPPERA